MTSPFPTDLPYLSFQADAAMSHSEQLILLCPCKEKNKNPTLCNYLIWLGWQIQSGAARRARLDQQKVRPRWRGVYKNGETKCRVWGFSEFVRAQSPRQMTAFGEIESVALAGLLAQHSRDLVRLSRYVSITINHIAAQSDASYRASASIANTD